MSMGRVSHAITVEQCKVAWGKINPKLRDLAPADYGERESNLFGPGFLENASKRLEADTDTDPQSMERSPNPSADTRPRCRNGCVAPRLGAASGGGGGGAFGIGPCSGELRCQPSTLDNIVADRESSTLGASAEWMLERSVCHWVLQSLGPCSVDLFASRLNNQLDRCQLAARSIYSGIRCIAVFMAGRDGLCFSSIHTHRQVSSEGAPGGVHTGHRGANMGHTAKVPSVAGRVPDSSSNTPESVARSVQQAKPPVSEQPTTVSRVESIRENHLAEAITKRASDLILSGWSVGTNATYQSGWAKWSS